MDNKQKLFVNYKHPANDGILAHLKPRTEYLDQYGSQHFPDCSPDSIDDPYMNLGVHPDVVEGLWDVLTVSLPVKCHWVVLMAPVLVHPKTGVIFGYAGGTSICALRLPESAMQEALKSGLKKIHTYKDYPPTDISTFGQDWILCNGDKEEKKWCLAAYEYAGTL